MLCVGLKSEQVKIVFIEALSQILQLKCYWIRSECHPVLLIAACCSMAWDRLEHERLSRVD